MFLYYYYLSDRWLKIYQQNYFTRQSKWWEVSGSIKNAAALPGMPSALRHCGSSVLGLYIAAPGVEYLPHTQQTTLVDINNTLLPTYWHVQMPQLCAKTSKNYMHTIDFADYDWLLVCWWWSFDWSFAQLIAPVSSCHHHLHHPLLQ